VHLSVTRLIPRRGDDTVEQFRHRTPASCRHEELIGTDERGEDCEPAAHSDAEQCTDQSEGTSQ